MIEFVDPRGETSAEEQAYVLSCDLRSDAGESITVALIANGFPDSELFVKKVGLALKQRLPNVKTLFWNKNNAGVAASEGMLDDIFATCDAAIAAYGH